MSGQQAESPTQQEEFDKYFIVFDGSSPEDVSHAKQLWSSLSLHPPLESRLVSADIRQRLPVARPHRRTRTGPRTASPEPPSAPPPSRQRQEERQRYLAMADQRREILGLLRRQREQRIQKELVSLAHKPNMKDSRGKEEKQQKPSDQEMDKEIVKQLQ
ncbi:cilia- and flagella-associated protein HOATZ [Centroberyx gerrardi]|uniref:cilia- and flagella-associated protein HOATZ n=1 Tax=Centroberyx gerrardi TaxID=166262 RepID=UPI003AB02B44